MVIPVIPPPTTTTSTAKFRSSFGNRGMRPASIQKGVVSRSGAAPTKERDRLRVEPGRLDLPGWVDPCRPSEVLRRDLARAGRASSVGAPPALSTETGFILSADSIFNRGAAVGSTADPSHCRDPEWHEAAPRPLLGGVFQKAPPGKWPGEKSAQLPRLRNCVHRRPRYGPRPAWLL